jgi:ribosomal protein L20
MKSKEEIEQLAERYADGYSTEEAHASYIAFQDGYTQCQEDMADKKYTEDDMLKLWNTLMVAMTNKNPIFFKDYINSLNKQDSDWLTMKEGDITVNFKPMPEFDEPKYPEVKIICPRCKTLMPCSCNSSWDIIMAESGSWDDSEILAYIIKNYNPPTKKQDNE